MNSNNKKKLILITIVGLFFALSIFLLTTLLPTGGKQVVLVALPKDSAVSIDGKITKSDSVTLSEGNHTLRATRQYFKDYQVDISYDDIKNGDTIYLLPEPNTPQAFQLLANDRELQEQREAAGGAESARIQKILLTNYPIISELPYENSHFKIGYKLEDTSNVVFTIALYGIINSPSQYDAYQQQLKQYKLEAINFLKANAVNTDKEKLEFTPAVD